MSTLAISRINANAPDFDAALESLLDRTQSEDLAITDTVRTIIEAVRNEGDSALIRYTEKFDLAENLKPADLQIPTARIKQAFEELPAEQRQALEAAANRVRSYHERQRAESWEYTDEQGTLLGQKVTPLDRVGLYVPGGKAAYPSSVLMNAIPARVAGVAELVMVVPTPAGVMNEMVLAAAHIAGVDRVFRIGGAQAVAALAYGTEAVPAVDKIVGPGNIYVATAKRLVFGQVDIDMIAGPSEIVVVCDGDTNPDWVAMDLFSQAEHDELAQSVLITPNAEFADAVLASMNRLIEDMPRADIIRTSLQDKGAIIVVSDLDQAAAVSNRIAPEHLELSVEDPRALAEKIHHAGAIFLGRFTAEAVGDYCAGPNHVLPTSGTARFSSPLGVYDFQKRTSLIGCSAESASLLGETAAILAHGEGLTAHARSAEYRIRHK